MIIKNFITLLYGSARWLSTICWRGVYIWIIQYFKISAYETNSHWNLRLFSSLRVHMDLCRQHGLIVCQLDCIKHRKRTFVIIIIIIIITAFV